MVDHPPTDDLADAAEGLLDPGRAVDVAEHLRSCAACRRTSAALVEVSQVLAATPAPTMPPGVDARLRAAVAAESTRRGATAGRAAVSSSAVPRRRSLGPFGTDVVPAAWWRRLAPVLAAATVAAAVGSGGYVVSAAAGRNEPPLVGATLSSADLAGGARSLETADEPSPHRFSRAWFCGRSVTDGRVTGLVRARVDGAPALVVYTRDDDATTVSVVTGCAGGGLQAGPAAEPSVASSAVLPR